MKLKIIIPIVLMGAGFAIWANFSKEDNSKYVPQPVEAEASKYQELSKVVQATIDLHKKQKTKTLERIFAITPSARALIQDQGGEDPFIESMNVLNKHSHTLSLNGAKYQQFNQGKNCYRVIAKTADETQVCFSFRKSKSGYKIVSIAEL